MKIQTKISLLFLTLSTGILILLNAFILYFEYQFNYADFFKRLETRVNLTAQIRLFPGEKSTAYSEVRNRYLEKLDSEKEQLIKADSSGSFKNTTLPNEFFFEVTKLGTAQYRTNNQFFAGKIFSKANQKYLVVVSALNPYGLSEIQELQRILFIGFLGSLIIAFFVGKMFSSYTFNPVRKLTDQVKIITSNNLHLRLDEPAGKDEIAELTHTFNNMLNRLETAFATQNNFVSNASHELRTPLTIINSELEFALSKDDLTVTTKETLNLIHSETDKLTQILNSLLLLAQSGFDGKKQNWQKIRIDELLWLSVEAVRKINIDSKIQVDFNDLPENENMLHVNGNNNLLRLAITNIINNACKYSQNKLVSIKLYVEHKKIIISVTDDGIGIPLNEQQYIFDPFFRASNTHEFQGHGVGLPLTLNIIRLHKGTIAIRSEENAGTEIQVLLPVAEA
ncbi:HAMP domain-containing protein [Pedobacter sp. HMF7647]|uniref:histidine kinase n=1 Tax=Hufsiella arboris TaxID=2695275 RepID=A0A7K1YCS6_9SPHI|nr:HAMP domain-containing sensor histidine kinase [Hufsiella arboris]MXV52386.1 HAMP domain-containing protein [Hufsiella arboris]